MNKDNNYELKQRILYRIILVLISLMFTINTTYTQEQWKFYLAFEDATGARDTIWHIWDTTATFLGADTHLGEVTAIINPDAFNVWTYNHGLSWQDTIKTVAYPYNYDFSSKIRAINFNLPIYISWDSSLFHAPFLPPEPVGWVNYARFQNDYFFFYNNSISNHQFDLTLANDVYSPDSSVTNPWFWDPSVHFPMDIYLSQDHTLIITDLPIDSNNPIKVWPNPASNIVNIESNAGYLSLRVVDTKGNILLKGDIINKGEINISSLPAGLYLLIFIDHKNHYYYYEKILKSNP